jgi:hypothetical protein
VEKLVELAPLYNLSVPLSQARDNFYVLCKDGTIDSRDLSLNWKLRCRYQVPV